MRIDTPFSMAEVQRDFVEQVVTRAMERATPTELAARVGHRVQGSASPSNGLYGPEGFTGLFLFNETPMA